MAFSDLLSHDSLVTPSMQTTVSDIFKSVLTDLQCPACQEYMVPPINFCVVGHNICKNCRPTVSSCPTCKQGILDTRNATLENLSLKMKFTCRYRQYGCKDTFPYNASRVHQTKCGYSPQTCPVDYLKLKRICTWSGVAKDVKQHLQTAHKDLCEDYNDRHLLLLPRYSAPRYTYRILFAYKEIFCYRLVIDCGIINVVLYHIGLCEKDFKFQYKVIVMNDEDTEGVVVTHPARRVTETEDDEFLPKNCVKLHHDLTEPFRNEKGELVVLIKILMFDD